MSMKPLQTRYLITVQRPLRWFLSVVLLVALVAAAIWLSYEQGLRSAGFAAADASMYAEQLQLEIEGLKTQLAESQRQTAMLERNSRIDGDTSNQLKMTLSEAQNETLELKKELAFYKSIVAPEQGKRSVVIQTIQLKKDDSGHFDYKIMVSQQGRNDRFARGSIDVSVEGTRQGQKQVVALNTISDEAKKPMKFGFKYFQNFTGKLKLPDGFEAESMRIKLKPRGSALDPVDEEFPWADLIAGEEYVGRQQ